MFDAKKHPEYLALYDKFKNYEYGSIITYEQMNAQMPNNQDVRKKHYWAVYKFMDMMLKEQNKLMENIQNIGYKIVKPNEHVRMSNKRLGKATRQVKKSVEYLSFCDVSMLSEDEKMDVMTHQNRKMLVYGVLLGEKRKLGKKGDDFSLPPSIPSFKR